MQHVARVNLGKDSIHKPVGTGFLKLGITSEDSGCWAEEAKHMR